MRCPGQARVLVGVLECAFEFDVRGSIGVRIVSGDRVDIQVAVGSGARVNVGACAVEILFRR